MMLCFRVYLTYSFLLLFLRRRGLPSRKDASHQLAHFMRLLFISSDLGSIRYSVGREAPQAVANFALSRIPPDLSGLIARLRFSHCTRELLQPL